MSGKRKENFVGDAAVVAAIHEETNNQEGEAIASIKWSLQNLDGPKKTLGGGLHRLWYVVSLKYTL